MGNEIEFQNEEWFGSLLDDCQSTLTEGIHYSRWTLIQTYHLLGKRILEDKKNFEKHNVKKDKSIVEIIAGNLNQSTRNIYYAMQFARKYPKMENVLSELPEGKTISWKKIITDILPEGKEEHECEFVPITMYECKHCKRKRISKH